MNTDDAVRDIVRATRHDAVASDALDRLIDALDGQFEDDGLALELRNRIAIERVAR